MRRSIFLLPLMLAGVLLCRSSHAADRDTALALMSGADALLQQNKYDKALSICERALGHDQDCPRVHLVMGLCHAKMGQAEKALACYQKAEALAEKEKDDSTVKEARDALKKMSPGLLKIQECDQKLLSNLLMLGKDALNDGHLDTADQIFCLILAQWPDHAEAASESQKCRSEIAKRGDPVRGKIAEAMLAEVWYLVGMGNKAEAREMAHDLANKYSAMSAGEEAKRLLAADFKAPGQNEEKVLKEKLVARAKSKKEPATALSKPSPSATPNKPQTGMSFDLPEMEKKTADETSKVTKAELVSAFNKAYLSGLEEYRQAKPGSEGNQEHLAKALEQFLKCEALYARAEAEKLTDAKLNGDAQQASMLRYACMKMVVLH